VTAIRLTSTARFSREQAEAAVPRVKALLAEMGWGDVQVEASPRSNREDWQVGVTVDVPNAVAWQAWRLAGVPMACWSCHWMNGDYEANRACNDGNCAHPEGPATPPRELLVPRR
jgi:hypothetical protein